MLKLETLQICLSCSVCDRYSLKTALIIHTGLLSKQSKFILAAQNIEEWIAL